jgi:DNA-binding CsgD family transcriptional regulator
VIHGAALVPLGERRVTVIGEPAHPARISSLLMSVYGLTDREKNVTRLVLHGDSTAQIAQELCIAAHTVPAAARRAATPHLTGTTAVDDSRTEVMKRASLGAY